MAYKKPHNSSPGPVPDLNNIGAERAIIACVVGNGAEALIDLEEILSVNDMFGEHHQKLWSVLHHMVHEQGVKTFDAPSIMATAKTLGHEVLFDRSKDDDYLTSVFAETISIENGRTLASLVSKLSIARQATHCLKAIWGEVLAINGDESVDDLISTVEDPIFAFTAKVLSTSNVMLPIGHQFVERMQLLSADPKECIGLATGFQKYDTAIGGGLRPGVTVVGARPKVGKSFFCLNVALQMAQAPARIPVLYLDTELLRETQMIRLASLTTSVELSHIETGQFSKFESERKAIKDGEALMAKVPITHCSIAGQSIKAILSIVRRWITKVVKFDGNGKALPCVVIYDYIKLMDATDINGNMREHQLLGFLLTTMSNFAIKYEVPFLATIQLNREFDMSQSDRILWLCNSFTKLVKKTPEEANEDPFKNGDRKLIVTDTRYGTGMQDGQYINIVSDLARARMSEGEMFSEIVKKNKFPHNAKKTKASEE